jgi:hypothetical protein
MSGYSHKKKQQMQQVMNWPTPMMKNLKWQGVVGLGFQQLHFEHAQGLCI